MKRVELNPVERHRANERFIAAIFRERRLDPRLPLCYPYIMIEVEVEEKTPEGEIQKEQKERPLYLDEVIQEVLEILYQATLRSDRFPWEKTPQDRYPRVLKYRLGLEDGRRLTLKETALKMGVSRERIRQIEIGALQILRRFNILKKFEDFLVPTPEEIAERQKRLKRILSGLRRLRKKSEELKQRAKRYAKMIEGFGVKVEEFEVEEFEGVEPEALPPEAQALKEEREEFEAFVFQFPNNRVWNAVERADISSLSRLREAIETGQRICRVGEKGRKFLQEALQVTQQQKTPS